MRKNSITKSRTVVANTVFIGAVRSRHSIEGFHFFIIHVDNVDEWLVVLDK